MRILVTTDTLGGVWTYTSELVTGLIRRGVRVTLVSFGEIPGPTQTRWMERLSGLDYHPTAFKLEWMQNSEDDMEASAEYLSEIVEETRPDVLHFNQFYYGALAGPAPKVVVAHSDVVSWWLAVRGEEPPPSSWLSWYRNLVTRGLQGASTVAAPSRWMLDQVEMLYTKTSGSRVIYNGRTPSLFNPHVTKEDRIVTAGRIWDSGKNAGLLLQEDLPAPLCIGLGEACAIAATEMAEEAKRLRVMRDRLLKGLTAEVPDVVVNGDLEQRLPGNLNVGFPQVSGQALLAEVPDLSLSLGSACTSAAVEPSYVLKALGLPDELANGSIRIGLGRFTSVTEIDFAVDRLGAAVGRLRATAPQRTGAPAA